MTARIYPKSKRRFLRFNLSSLLLVVLVLCIWLGWKVERARKQREAVNWIRKSGGSVIYDYRIDDNYRGIANAEPPGPKWLMEQLGIDFFDDVAEVILWEKQVSDVSPLAGLTNLQWLYLTHNVVSDVTPLAGLTKLQLLVLSGNPVSDVTPLAGLVSLEKLDLRRTQVTDVTPLAGLTNLEWLYLNDTSVTDVSPLAGLASLEKLNLRGTQVTDVTPLAQLTSLKELDLRGMRVVSQEHYKMLREALPNCQINVDPLVSNGPVPTAGDSEC